MVSDFRGAGLSLTGALNDEWSGAAEMLNKGAGLSSKDVFERGKEILTTPLHSYVCNFIQSNNSSTWGGYHFQCVPICVSVFKQFQMTMN